MKVNKDRLAEIIRAFSGVELLVIGDLILDSYLECRALGVANEAPVPLVEIQSQRQTAGGAGNVATNLARLGVQTQLVAPLGDDRESAELKRILTEAGIGFHPLVLPRPSPHKTRIVSGRHYYLRLDEEQTEPLTEEETTSFEDVIQKAWGRPAALLVSDYDKGAVTPFLVRWLEPQAQQAKLPIYADLKPRNAIHWKNLSLITPNLSEARELFVKLQHESSIPEQPSELASTLSKQLSSQVVLKMSEQGLLAADRSGTVCRLGALTQIPVNVSGAGDTMFATLSAALAAGAALEEAAVLANVAASLAVAQEVTHAVSAQELQDAISRY
ncbi:MAG TPA: PfkB family carbohydrate kinase [Terriglobia bacterium]|nr:PfkB family carbohydrate kinase [Terriglobia bacterium]